MSGQTFVVLLYAEEGDWERADDATKQDYYRRHGDYADQAADFGVRFLANEALQPVATAVTLRRADQVEPRQLLGRLGERPLGDRRVLPRAPDREAVLRHAMVLPPYTIEIREIAQV